MLSENIKARRKSKGLSQEELAVKLNVVRQTVSKWEKGLSVPDSEMLIALSETLETPVSTLLGETVVEAAAEDLKAIYHALCVRCNHIRGFSCVGKSVLGVGSQPPGDRRYGDSRSCI